MERRAMESNGVNSSDAQSGSMAIGADQWYIKCCWYINRYGGMVRVRVRVRVRAPPKDDVFFAIIVFLVAIKVIAAVRQHNSDWS
jgi:hypothetical protein